jgi:hypothetical protein
MNSFIKVQLEYHEHKLIKEQLEYHEHNLSKCN